VLGASYDELSPLAPAPRTQHLFLFFHETVAAPTNGLRAEKKINTFWIKNNSHKQT